MIGKRVIFSLAVALLAVVAIFFGPPPVRSQAPAPSKPHVLIMIGEDEYQTDQTLPDFAKRELEPLGVQVTIVQADSKNPHSFSGLEALRKADLLLLSVRRRAPTTPEMALIHEHLEAGKPLVGIRTASHAFALRPGPAPAGHEQWVPFDKTVLGCRYTGHLDQAGTEVSPQPGAENDELLTGVQPSSFRSSSTLYRSQDLRAGTHVVLRGVGMEDGAKVTMPVAWTHRYNTSRIFYTSLGHRDDFQLPAFNRLLVNGILWALQRPIPGAVNAQAAAKAAQPLPSPNPEKEGIAANPEVVKFMRSHPRYSAVRQSSSPTPPADAVKKFQVKPPLEMKLTAWEPMVRQPLYMAWDRRGRLWVVQYLQFQWPAGLKVVKFDNYLRAVYDKVPAAPPNHIRGNDKITVLEDTDHDGIFDKSKDVITGLNIASSVALGRGGIWVLNPPYLLFYPDANGDDIPDRDPDVVLSGFGLEDTHSVASSLKWGPDGWLYGANGSTTTGTINSAATKNLHWKGQMIWRYHPDKKVFEIYAEGGGNTFSLDIDSVGQVFSGTNNGGTRGMHYVQGGYAVKSWGKHGPLTNPFAFGNFEHMRHEGEQERFSQTFVHYEGGAFPSEYQGMIITANALHNRVLASRLLPDTSTYRTVDLPPLVTTSDHWFRPVDVEVGPDGGVYMADWYDARIGHNDPYDTWHRESGRIYRLQVKGAPPEAPLDLTKLSNDALIDLFGHKNKWFRFEAVRLLGERHDASALSRLRELFADQSDPRALPALWALHLCGRFDDNTALKALAHANPDVRRWGSRLVGDHRQASTAVAQKLADLALTEPDVHVRSQLASTAKRLPATQCLPIVRSLMTRKEDVDDLHLPLLIWWALESKSESDRDAVLALFQDKELWKLTIVDRTILGRLMQRYAMSDDPKGLETCAQLLAMAPGPEQTARLMGGLLEAYRGRKIDDLPPALASALEKYQQGLGQSDLALGLRLGRKDAIDRALKVVADEKADSATRVATIGILGQIKQKDAVRVLTKVLNTTKSNSIKRAVLDALMNYDDPAIGQSVLSAYAGNLPDEQGLHHTAQRLLASRKPWALAFLKRVDTNQIERQTVSVEVVQQMLLHNDPQINELIRKYWGKVRATPAENQEQVRRLRAILKGDPGDPLAGRSVFTQHCATCHTLFGEGGQTGPDLTGYERTNLEFLIPSITDPSAGIREEFTNFAVSLNDGRTLTGLIDEQNPRTLTLRGADNQKTLVNRAEIEEIKALPISLMPDGLMAKLSDREVRDLFAYLMSRAPSLK
jgi:putative heme-binding domain-containing protein